MDSLTQIVLGASVGEAVLGKKIGNRAMLWGAIAGTIPDLDVFIRYFTDPITSTEIHRGVSHSILFAIVMAFVLGWLVHKNEKLTFGLLTLSVFGLTAIVTPSAMFRIIMILLILGVFTLIYFTKIKSTVTAKDWGKLFFWSLVTHPLLDAHTTWGTQLFWPFEYRLAYKNIFVADPLYTVPFLILVIAALCYKRSNTKRTKINNWALIISTSYMALTLVFKVIAQYKFDSALKEQGIAYTEMDTQPTPLNSILWSAQIETKTGFTSGYYSLFDSRPIAFHTEIPKGHYLLKPYENNKQVQQIKKIATSWYFVEKDTNGLVFTDIRFGQFGFDDSAQYMWKYNLKKNINGKLEVERSDFSPRDINMKKAFGDLWTRIKGN